MLPYISHVLAFEVASLASLGSFWVVVKKIDTVSCGTLKMKVDNCPFVSRLCASSMRFSSVFSLTSMHSRCGSSAVGLTSPALRVHSPWPTFLVAARAVSRAPSGEGGYPRHLQASHVASEEPQRESVRAPKQDSARHVGELRVSEERHLGPDDVQHGGIGEQCDRGRGT